MAMCDKLCEELEKANNPQRFLFDLCGGVAIDYGAKDSPLDHDAWQELLRKAERDFEFLSVLYFIRSCRGQIKGGKLFWGCVTGGTKEFLREFLFANYKNFLADFLKRA